MGVCHKTNCTLEFCTSEVTQEYNLAQKKATSWSNLSSMATEANSTAVESWSHLSSMATEANDIAVDHPGYLLTDKLLEKVFLCLLSRGL